MLLKNSFRVLCLALAVCALVACGDDDDPRFAGGRSEYMSGFSGGGDHVNAYNQHTQADDSVSYWDGDGVPGNPHIEVRLGEQRAYYYKGDQLVGVAQVSTGREGHETPSGSFKVQQKDKDHRSSQYGDYVDANNQTVVVKSNVENGKDPETAGHRVPGLVDALFPARDERRRSAPGLPAGRAREPWLYPDAGFHGGEFLLQHAHRHAGDHFQQLRLGCRRVREMSEMPLTPPLEISVLETQRLLTEKDAALRLVDVRDPDEFAFCKLPGAELISLQVLPTEASARLTDKDAEIVLYCHHGMRSARATEYLRSLGYTNARSMAGGIEQWSTEIDPTVPRY